MVARSVGVTRDQAKILNYGRIYGAGVKFAKQQIMNYNANLKEEQATKLAHKMYSETKGERNYILNNFGALCLSICDSSMNCQEYYLSLVGSTVDRKKMSAAVRNKRKIDTYMTYDLSKRSFRFGHEINFPLFAFCKTPHLGGHSSLSFLPTTPLVCVCSKSSQLRLVNCFRIAEHRSSTC